MKLSIVVPCYNEAANIPLILERFGRCIQRKDIEVLLVDNGSTDDSSQIIRKLLPQHPFARCVTVKVNQGYGFGILSGLRECRGEFLGWTHADMQTDPGDVIRGLELIEARDNPETLYVKGRRRNRPFFDQVFTSGMSLFETVYLGKVLYDINGQPSLFHKSFFAKWDDPPHDFALDLYVLYMARANGLEVLRFDVMFPERLHGESKWNTGLGAKWKFIKRTLTFSRELKTRLRTARKA